jgi:hypothetical protein
MHPGTVKNQMPGEPHERENEEGRENLPADLETDVAV